MFQKARNRVQTLWRFPFNLIPLVFLISLLTLRVCFRVPIYDRLSLLHGTPSTESPPLLRTTHSSLCPTAGASHELQPPPAATDATVRAYVELHAQIRACLTRASCAAEDAPVLIWACPQDGRYGGFCGGIGDRLRNIRKSLNFAITLRRALFVYWPAGNLSLFSLDTALQPAMIDWRMPARLVAQFDGLPFLDFQRDLQLFEVVRRDGHRVALLNASRDDMPTMLRAHPALITLRPPSIKKMAVAVDNPHMAANVAPGSLLRMAMFTRYERALTHSLFRPSAAVRRVVDTLHLDDGGFTGVHIRSGEDFNETEHERFIDMVKERPAVVDKLLRCAHMPVTAAMAGTEAVGERRVFLASDSTSYKTEFGTQARRRGLNVSMIDMRTVHFARLDQSVLGSRDQQCEMHLNLFADLVQLGRSGVLVTTGSGFTVEAFFLGNSSSVVLSPRSDRECFVTLSVQVRRNGVLVDQ